MRPPLLEVEELGVRLAADDRTGRPVAGVSFMVREGESVGLVGESGCGKTLAALAVMGLLPSGAQLESGSSVRLRGEELVAAPEKRLRDLRGREMAMIFQDPATALNPLFPVGGQIAEVVRRHQGASRPEAWIESVRLLREVGLPEAERVARQLPGALSGGMRQRVFVAMALAGRPALVIADEPTTALDVTVQKQVLDLMDRLRARRGAAFLVISHDLAVVARLCQTILVMYAGQIVESGPVEAVLASPRHPYTRGLLRLVTELTGGGGRLEPIPGSVPSPFAQPSGCRFAPRCPHVWDRCEAAPPLLTVEPSGEDSGERLSRCWLATEPGRKAATP